jgi:glyoxylase-like metal-dependent hydrolase (beta-lactamase superfamily II)
MKHRRILVALIAMMTSSIVLLAQEEPAIKVTQISDHLYLLSTDQGSFTTNSIVSVGGDGILLVDTQAESDAEALRKAVETFGKGAPRYIINTHRHVEHIGGNAIFGEAPVVIAHTLVPSKLRSGSFIFEEYPDATFPDITLADSLSLYFNGEKIRIIAFGGSHDDNEIIIHFTGSKVVHLSSVVNGFNFPSIDSDGDVFKFPEMVARAIDLLPEDVTIVSGHNDPGTWKELHAYHKMLVGSLEVIQSGLEVGKDLATLKAEKVLDEWKTYAGSYVSVDQWTEYIVNGHEKKDRPRKKNIYEPIYYAIKDGGLEAGVECYFDLKNNRSAEYEIKEVELMIIGDKYLRKDKIPEAIRFLELCVQESPSGKYAYFAHYDLANAYKEKGNKELAIKNCEKALQLNQDFQAAVELLEELKDI